MQIKKGEEVQEEERSGGDILQCIKIVSIDALLFTKKHLSIYLFVTRLSS
jgi:hypothetical protein